MVMEAAKKGKKVAKPKKGSKGKKKTKNNNSMNFFSKIMLALLFISIITIAVFLIAGNIKTDKAEKPKIELQTLKKDSQAKEEIKPETKKEIKKEEPKNQKPESKSESKSKTLSGSWLSSEQGAAITLDEYGYRIDFFGVDASKPMTGNYTIEKNLIVFASDDGDCKGSGTYRITFYKDNFSLIAKDDDCTQRRNILEADWEWMEF